MATQLMTLNNQFHNNILDVGERVMWNCCFLLMSVIYVNHRTSLINHIDEIFLKGFPLVGLQVSASLLHPQVC